MDTNEINLVSIDKKPYFERYIGAVVCQLRVLNPNCTHIFWTLETENVRAVFGTNESPGDKGHLLLAGSSGVWSRAMAQSARFVSVAGQARIRVTQLRSA